MDDDYDRAAENPHWLLTFADMMALLLTFFVMLVSFSELKSEEKYQALLDAFQQQFAADATRAEDMGGLRPRVAELARRASARSEFLATVGARTIPTTATNDTTGETAAADAEASDFRTVLYLNKGPR